MRRWFLYDVACFDRVMGADIRSVTDTIGKQSLPLDRRALLKAGLGIAGLAAVGSACGAGGSKAARALAACGVTQRCPRPTIRKDSGSMGSFPGPFTSGLLPGYANMILLYDTLMWTDSTGALLPWLASGYRVSADGLTYTYRLRDNVTWSDGHPLTASDVVFSFEYTTAFKGPEPLGVPAVPVTVRATGPLSVEVVQSQPNATFQTFTGATLPIIPEHIWSPIADPAKAQDLAVLVGTGPYRLASYNSTQATAEYVARDGYFLGKPFVKAIQAHPVANGDDLEAVLAGDIDVGVSASAGVPPSALGPFHGNPAYGILTRPDGYATTLRWNLAKGGPYADIRFRQACAMAINRQDMVTRLLGGDGQPGNPGYLAPISPWYDASAAQYPFDLAGAERLLDQAGYKRGPSGTRLGHDGRPLLIPMLVNSGTPAAGQLVAAYLGAVGIEVSSEAVDIPTLFGRLGPGNYELAIAFNGGARGDPDIIRQNFCTPGFVDFRHTNGYDSAELNALGVRQLGATNLALRRQLVNQMQAIVARDLPIMTLYYANSYVVYNKSVFDQWGTVPPGVDGGPFYNPDKEGFVFGVTAGMRGRPELA